MDHEDVVRVPPLPVHAELHFAVLKDLGESWLVNRLPWSVLNISGLPRSSASIRASAQKPASIVLDRRQDRTYWLCQSMTTTM